MKLFEDLGPDIARLREIALQFTQKRQARNTELGYAADWRTFEAFCASIGRAAIPTSEDSLCLYVVDSLRTKKLSTIARRLGAIKNIHKKAGLPLPDVRDMKVLSEVLKGAKRTFGTASEGKAALQPEELRAMCRALLAQKTPRAIRDRAILTIGFTTATRRSELSALELRDVRFVPQGLTVTIRKGKTDQEGKGLQVAVFEGKRASTCPVRALKAWLKIRGRHQGPLFPGRSDPSIPMRAKTVLQAVKYAARLAGIDETKLGAHSLRAGFITAAAEGGTPETIIMQTTGHKRVQTVANYVRPARLFRVNALADAM